MAIYPHVPLSSQNIAIDNLLHLERSTDLIERVVAIVSLTIIRALGHTTTPENESLAIDASNLPKFTAFVRETITRADIAVRVILVSLIYVRRIGPLLHLPTERYARERIFIGALVLANKVRFASVNNKTLTRI